MPDKIKTPITIMRSTLSQSIRPGPNATAKTS
jgi:hypothetical protein